MRTASARRRRNPITDLLVEYWPYLVGAGAVGVVAAVYVASSKPPVANLGIFAMGRILLPGQAIYSQNNQYALVMQKDGNLVVYKNPVPNQQSGIWTGQALWGSGNSGHPGAIAAMQGDGNLVMYDAGATVSVTGVINGNVLHGHATGNHSLPTDTNGHPGAFAVMQNDGNFVIYNAGATVSATGTVTGTPLWATDTAQAGGAPPSASPASPPASSPSNPVQNVANQGQAAVDQGQAVVNQVTSTGNSVLDLLGGGGGSPSSGSCPDGTTLQPDGNCA